MLTILAEDLEEQVAAAAEAAVPTRRADARDAILAVEGLNCSDNPRSSWIRTSLLHPSV
jgi:hypothetical protein